MKNYSMWADPQRIESNKLLGKHYKSKDTDLCSVNNKCSWVPKADIYSSIRLMLKLDTVIAFWAMLEFVGYILQRMHVTGASSSGIGEAMHTVITVPSNFLVFCEHKTSSSSLLVWEMDNKKTTSKTAHLCQALLSAKNDVGLKIEVEWH